MPLRDFIEAQLNRPSGWFGRVVMPRLLNRGNARINRHTVEALDPQPHEHVLEIGFGGGDALTQVLARLETGRAVGLELSPELVARAERAFRRAVAAERCRFLSGDIHELPLDGAAFDAAYTVNTVYFWGEPARALAELHRVLKPGGRLVLALRSPAAMQRLGVSRERFRVYDADALEAMLATAGFTDVTRDHLDAERKVDSLLVLARADK